ncbi:hypothetical protein EVAR_71569_1 [Eumeta japonica]|uniref:Uncharacterized protein n=1 Tax=Eumeta variegata TaxID=151549 RepID=A0A4C1TUD4_EUMVA|nr:hypothetical protein EVAR_71569_1 [Eumeta japonica]
MTFRFRDIETRRALIELATKSAEKRRPTRLSGELYRSQNDSYEKKVFLPWLSNDPNGFSQCRHQSRSFIPKTP